MPKGDNLRGKPRHPNSGRKKGQPNKFTTLKAAFLNAFQKIGGEEALAIWAREHGSKKDFYLILSKMLPRDISITDNTPLSDAEREARLRVLVERLRVKGPKE